MPSYLFANYRQGVGIIIITFTCIHYHVSIIGIALLMQYIHNSCLRLSPVCNSVHERRRNVGLAQGGVAIVELFKLYKELSVIVLDTFACVDCR